MPVQRCNGYGSHSAEGSCAGRGAQLLRVTHSVAGKWVARATRPCRSATRRPERRGSFLQRSRLYCLQARYPLRPAGRRAYRPVACATTIRISGRALRRYCELPQWASISFAERTKSGTVSDGSIRDRMSAPAREIKALTRLFFRSVIP